MKTSLSNQNLSRCTTIAGLTAGGIGVALGSRHAGAAQEMTTADHPLMGMWLAMRNPSRQGVDPQSPAPSLYSADGTVILGFVPA